MLLVQLRSSDKAYFDVGLAVAREMPGADAMRALANELGELPPERRALLLRALTDRKEPVEISVLRDASKSESAAVQEAAIHALAKRGDAEAITLLLDAALGNTKSARLAKEELKTLSGRPIAAAVRSRLESQCQGENRPFRSTWHLPNRFRETGCVQALTDPDGAVRLAAIAALRTG